MKNITLVLLAALAFASCAKDTTGIPSNGDPVYFKIVPEVASSVSAEMTRARVDGTFTASTRIGLSIVSNPSLMKVHPLYYNFYGQYNGSLWGYYLPPSSYLGTLLSGFASWNQIYVIGYYPYDPAMTDVSAIPFSIGNIVSTNVGSATEERATVDYMVAGTQQKDMTASGGGVVSLGFDHLMTSISLYWRRNYQGPQIKLSKVQYIIDGTRKFGIGGTYNAVNPNMSDMASNLTSTNEVQTLDVEYTSSEKTFPYRTSWTETPLLIMPELRHTGTAGDPDDATVTLTFFFTDAFGSPFEFDNSTQGNPMFSFKLSDIDNGVGADKGFLSGSNYRIQMDIGTYVRFEGTPYVVDENMDDQTDPEHIEI